MGIKQSIYEKPGTLNYYKFSAEEYTLVKKLWSEIEINPQFHGNAYLKSFCETYPQYLKYFTLEPRLPVNFDARTTAKFSMIMETMGFILLDFNNKPKQLDRFLGYIAMMHKDMRLNEQDMHNFVLSLFEYLWRTFPTQMTAQCQEAMSKYINSIIKELSKKMETFRNYDLAQADVTTRLKLPWGWCPIFAEPLIFGKTKVYWDEWKKQWDTRLDEWEATQDAGALNSVSTLSTDEEDRNDDESETGILQRKASALIHRRRTVSDVSATKLQLLSLSKTLLADEAERPPSRSRRRRVRRVNERREQSQRSVRRSEKPPEAANSREKRQADTRIRRRRSRIDRTIVDRTFDGIVSEKADKKPMKREFDRVPKSLNTARERRRERFNDLQ